VVGGGAATVLLAAGDRVAWGATRARTRPATHAGGGWAARALFPSSMERPRTWDAPRSSDALIVNSSSTMRGGYSSGSNPSGTRAPTTPGGGSDRDLPRKVNVLLIVVVVVVAAGTTVAGMALVILRLRSPAPSWSPLGSGMNGYVFALAVDGSALYAGGDFTSPGSRIAKWDGTQWSTLGSGMNGGVYALAVHDNALYAGGSFTSPGGYIAKWDGTQWSTLGSGMNDAVSALAVHDSALYAGGSFTSPGICIAKWDGTQWSTLGSGMDHWVYALAVHANALYAGGYFKSPGNRTAKWE